MVVVMQKLALVLLCCSINSVTSFSFDHNNNKPGDAFLHPSSRALEFGDFTEDIPEECPATTTCPVVCRANVTDCPTPQCAPGLTLCITGNCEVDCSVHDSLYTNPCICPTLSVACPKTIELQPVCYETYQEYYDNHTTCAEEIVESAHLVSFVGPWFLVCYIGYAMIAILVVGWCFYNQILCPVEHSTVPLVASVATTATKQSTAEVDNSSWTQTGYTYHWIGLTIYALLAFSFVIIQFLLLITTLFYYMQQGAITRWTTVFQDEIQVLKVFQIVWMFGFVWCFAFRYPTTGIDSLFLRRCTLDEATHVAVVAPIHATDPEKLPTLANRIATYMWVPIDFIFRGFFSYKYGHPNTETIFCAIETDTKTGTRSILHRMRRYTYDNEKGYFVPCVLSIGTTFVDLLGQIDGLTQDQADERRGIHGPNVIHLSKPTIIGCLCREFGKGFYLYQNFSVWSFANFFYYFMAIVNTVVRVMGALVVTYFQYRSECLLYKLANVEGTVEVLRDGEYIEIPVEDVVPGDVVVLKPGVVYCDMVVLKGYRVLVDESALTGESAPVLKAEVDPSRLYQTYKPRRHKLYTISAGTEILEVDDNEKALGLVFTTGSFTTKGELMTNVLSYQRHKSQFDDEMKVVLSILVLEAVFMIALVFHFLNDDWVFSWFYGAYVLATVIPPLLPTVFVVSLCVSAKRLQDKRISCPYPESILLAGKVNAAFFDKTGTLTRHGLDFISYNGHTSEERIRLGMAVCHTLTTTLKGEIVGNHVDLAAFSTTGAEIHHGKGEPNCVSYLGKTYTILKQFEFDNSRATQSVIVEDDNGKRQIFVKGSSEVIKELCMPSSLPTTFDATVNESARNGIYQIVMAVRSYNLDMPMAQVRREDVESSLTFCGFINFRNQLREETKGVLEEIAESEMKVAMITGDNTITGICIARESGMLRASNKILLAQKVASGVIQWIDYDSSTVVDAPSLKSLLGSDIELAISGNVWNSLLKTSPEYLNSIMGYIRVFGRCKPEDKVSIVDAFVEQGYTTLMCGDGQNDCGCLKAAHIGVALSNAEASVVAPFTSLNKTLVSVLDVLREGRCALASTVSAYSYYIIYGQTETYLQVIMAYLSVTFSEWCWVFLDGIWSISLAFSIPLSKAADRLTPRRPTNSVLGSETMFSVCGILAWNFFFVVVALIVLYQQDWFQCRKWNSNDVSSAIIIGDNYESSVLFIVGGYQYVASAIVLNYGYSFRQPWHRNYLFLFLSITWTLFVFMMTMHPSSFSCIWRVNCTNEHVTRFVTSAVPMAINNPFNSTIMPVHFRWMLVIIMAANFVTISIWQTYFVNGYLVSSKEDATQQPHLLCVPTPMAPSQMERSEGTSTKGDVSSNIIPSVAIDTTLTA